MQFISDNIEYNPEYLKISNSLLLNNLIKNNWVVIKNINGNISKISEGEFKIEI